ncbi:uncharacterized protein SPPG_06324 [Spizellomyces punctatus DAOM BR117]|uniref:[histone H3]-lysine(36) N-trimethyltransferase n=1 Tax=Spizellomyces punctatus (strain DAOM BR117) TaxID=645134 RepID=A0A0L0HD60_SPIPD|nr:uncharacterized protein SPPG_06324 [Spizellomyces punctatus DAOM BR117]KNC98643.1 hypothetical protein SPPG_06324 [Spizellomyces punctatus DAOM BR117]|eukprot:XP_016606683.1 hypothetical protein SPPG_06324 [Spizellomyces punctatus DAOM BR117]
MVVDPMQHKTETVIESWSMVKKEHVVKEERLSWHLTGSPEEHRSVVIEAEPVPTPPTLADGDVKDPPAPISCDKPTCSTPEVAEKVSKTYTHILSNEFKGGANGKTPSDEYMICDCRYVPGQNMRHQACGEESNCINKELFIECMGETCPAGQYCQNRRFQNRHYAPIEIFETEKKGFGLRATAPIRGGSFIIEYCGEVITGAMFKKRIQEYDKQGRKHFYFMSLKANEFIDASKKGNMSRFMNHSCSPNCALHKWVVGSNWRIGIFALRDLDVGEELSFDYKFERYGAKAQECFCGSANCKGYIGGKQAEIVMNSDDEGDSDMENSETDKPRATRRRKRGGEDSDYEGEAVRQEAECLHNAEDVQVVTRSLFRHAAKPKRIMRLLSKIENTNALPLQRRFIWGHGLSVLKMCLREYTGKNAAICLQVLRILRMLPIASKNTAEKVEDCVVKLAELPDLEISTIAKELVESWSTLQSVYKIPKRIPPPPDSDAPKEATGQDSPSQNGGSKRSYDEPDGDRVESYSPRSKRSRSDDREGERRYSSSDSRNRHDMYRPSYFASRAYPPEYADYETRSPWSRRGSGNNDSDYSGQRPYPRSAVPSHNSSVSGSPRYGHAPYPDHRTTYSSEHEHTPRRPSQADRPLPLGWKATRTEDGAVYYYNVNTREAQWEFPSESGEPANDERATLPSMLPGVSESAIRAVVEEANAVQSSPEKPSPHKEKRVSHPTSSTSDFPKKLKVEIGNFVVKQMSKYKIPSEKFKDLARAVTKALVDKERRTHSLNDNSELSEHKKSKIKIYVKEYCKRNGYLPKLQGGPSPATTGRGNGNDNIRS